MRLILDHRSVLQYYWSIRRPQSKELSWLTFFKIALIDVHFIAETNSVAPLLWMGREVGDCQYFLQWLLGLNHNFNRLDHRHEPHGACVQVLPDAVFQQLNADHVFVPSPGHSQQVNEGINRSRSVPSPPQPFQRGHPGVVPTFHYSLCDELCEFPFAEDSVGNVESGVFPDHGSSNV